MWGEGAGRQSHSAPGGPPVVVVVAVPRDVALLALVMAAVAALAGVVVAVAPSLWSSSGQHLVRCQ